MCGLIGYSSSKGVDRQTISAMTMALSHRGPDAQAFWIDPEAGIALGHTRLSILDLSPLGRQPMISSSGRYVIIFNGEVYNFLELQKELTELGFHFKGGSDTEVILAAIEAWGLTRSVKRFVGMFAMAIWDRRDRSLALVRDRLGIKPLYYGWWNGSFLFGSELHAFRECSHFDPEISYEALGLMIKFSYVPAPLAIYEGAYKMPPGTILTLSHEQLRVRPGNFVPHAGKPNGVIRPFEYWSAEEVASQSKVVASDEEIIDELERLLLESVRLRMIADVPLGAFLSGGVDSSTVVALMQKLSSAPIKTFSIGFRESSFNEAPHAQAVARHLGTDHTELIVSPQTALDLIPSLSRIYDEPFGDSSQIPTFLISKLARGHVKVALSGDGGDELFGGYDRYQSALGLWRHLQRTPQFILQPIGYLLRSRLFALMQGRFPSIHHHAYTRRNSLFFDKASKLGAASSCSNFAELYELIQSVWTSQNSTMLLPQSTSLLQHLPHNNTTDLSELMMLWDLKTYLADDILTKVDRASMSVALEARVPLLDHRVVQFAWKLPLSARIRHGQGKWALRKLLHRYVPAQLVDRPKMGFSVPVGEWLKTELFDWAEALINKRRLTAEGIFEANTVRSYWKDHIQNVKDGTHQLWNILMFQAWREEALAPSRALPWSKVGADQCLEVT